MSDKITIYGELHSSKNGKMIVNIKGRPMLISKSSVRQAEKAIQQQLILNKSKWLRIIEGSPKPLEIVFKIYRQTRRRFDYVNIVQQLLDCMTACGLIPDDNADEMIPVFEPYEVDKTNPRVDIFLKNS